jgi:hypothetical protein
MVKGYMRRLQERIPEGAKMLDIASKWGGALALVAAAWACSPAWAATHSQHQRVDGMDVYYGIVPASVAMGHHPAGHPESVLSGGYAAGRYHLVVSLKDRRSGQPVTDAQVTAIVNRGLGHREAHPLHRMTVNDAVSYGNYFTMARPGTYDIQVLIKRPGIRRVRLASFTYQQR